MADEPSTPAGDEPAETPDAPTPAAETEPEETPKDDQLPPEVKAILDKERKAARDAEKQRKVAEKALTTATSELDKFREAQLTEQEKAVKAAREEGLNEGRSVGDKRLIRAEIIAAAAGKAADPGDVYAILTGNGALSGVEVSEDGEVDTEVIRGLVEALVKDKPHLAAVRTPSFGARAQAQAERPEADMDAWIRGQAGR
jgi:hypothetical protein